MINKKWCLLMGTIIFAINIILLFLKDYSLIIVYNSICIAGIIDYYKFMIPDTCSIIILLIFLFNFNFISLFYAIIIFSILFILFYINKMGFGDVKLLTAMALFFQIKVFHILIFSILTVYILNYKKEDNKVAFGYYIFLGTSELILLEVIINVFIQTNWFIG